MGWADPVTPYILRPPPGAVCAIAMNASSARDNRTGWYMSASSAFAVDPLNGRTPRPPVRGCARRLARG